MQNTTKHVTAGGNLLRDLTKRGDQSWERLLHRPSKPDEAARLDPPANFHFLYLVSRPTPYASCEADGREQVAGGVLEARQVVWLEQPLPTGKVGRRVTAFTPSAGMIRLNVQNLSQVCRG